MEGGDGTQETSLFKQRLTSRTQGCPEWQAERPAASNPTQLGTRTLSLFPSRCRTLLNLPSMFFSIYKMSVITSQNYLAQIIKNKPKYDRKNEVHRTAPLYSSAVNDLHPTG